MSDEQEYSRSWKRTRRAYLSQDNPPQFSCVEFSESFHSIDAPELSLTEDSSHLTINLPPSTNEPPSVSFAAEQPLLENTASSVSKNPNPTTSLTVYDEHEQLCQSAEIEIPLYGAGVASEKTSQIKIGSPEPCGEVISDTPAICHEAQADQSVGLPEAFQVYSHEGFAGAFDEQLLDISNDYPELNVEEEMHIVDYSVLDDATVDLDEHAAESSTVHTKDDLPYEGAPINLWESLTAILTFAQSEKISGASLARLISLISIHLPQPNKFFQSNHTLFKLLEKQKEAVDITFFCTKCYKIRPSISELCDVCTDDARSVNYFITLPLAPQIRKLYERPDFVQDIKYKSTRVKENDNNIEDIYDGEIYKEAERSFLTSDTDLTFTWNTDGLQVFKSTSYSMWPWYLVVNELPPEKRYLSENMLIAGIWGSVVKPHPNIYLKKIYNELSNLRKGIDVKFYNSDVVHKIKCCVLCGTCDAPARASFLNMKSHSGFYSCPICLCRGVRYDNTTVFPFEENFPLRTPQQYEDCLRKAVNTRVILTEDKKKEEECKGIKGPTILSGIVQNPFKTTAIDSMHCVYLGVTRQLLHLWFDKDDKDEKWSIHSKIKIVSGRLLKMTPPHFVERAAQSIEKLTYWKASELRTFLFYYCLCILSGVLRSEEYFQHLVKFVKGVALLNKSSVSEEDIRLASLLLNEFVSDFERLYGRRNMSHNLHMLLHLADSVKMLAPLFITSCFKFEDMNGRLCNLIHGTRHAGLQVHSNLSIITNLSLMVHDLRNGPAKDFCTQIKNKWMRLRITEKISDGVYCVGDLSSISATNEWILDMLIDNGIFPPHNDSVLIFHRLLKDKMLHASANYKRGQRVSSLIKYSDSSVEKFGSIEYFIKVRFDTTVDYYAVVNNFTFETQFGCDHIFSGVPSHIEIISLCNLDSILYKVTVGDKMYFCDALNKFELE